MADTQPVPPDAAIDSGIFDEVSGEYDAVPAAVSGALPRNLRGTLYTNGAGRWKVGDAPVRSLFDVDGMIGAFVLDGSGVRFRNRYVRTTTYENTTRAGRLINRGVAHQRFGGVRANFARLPANTANTSVLIEDSTLLALNEIGSPYCIDPDTLATIGRTCLDGTLRGPAGAYSAHPTRDPARGVTVNFGLDPFYPRVDAAWVRGADTGEARRRRFREQIAELVPRVRLRIYETDRFGSTKYVRAVPLPVHGRLPLIHDMALTERYAVFTVSPYQANTVAMLSGVSSMWDAMELVSGAPSYIILVPRNGDAIRSVETDPFFSWHFTNAFDDGHDVVIELARWSLDTLPGMKRFGADTRLGINAVTDGLSDAQRRQAGRITRLRIRSDGRVSEECVAELLADFPQFDQRRTANRHHVTFVLVHPNAHNEGTGIARIDARTGATQVYQPLANLLSEPIFVPRSPHSPEGQGWILSVGYHQLSHRSRLMIFDAEHLDAGPVAEAWLPFHLPMRFHGAFTAKVARI
jgi:all-trans-8'-apo-beta-carotenal 15,15'-oxygenase